MAGSFVRTIALVSIAALAAAFTPYDLDIEPLTGCPFDCIKAPKETPTGGRANDTSTGGGGNKPPSGEKPKPGDPTKPGETVAENPYKKPPPKPPSGLPGISVPTTIDYQAHLGWKPKDDLVDFQDPMKGATATGPYRPEKPPEKWDTDYYPPQVPNDIYVYAVCRYLMVMLHPAMVNERELTQFLIEMDYPAHYAATACKHEPQLKRMATEVMDGVGPMAKTPPNKPAGDVAVKVWMDLLSRYCYEANFGLYILSQPTEQTLPVILDIVKNQKHPFLVRNAAFVLRCYNTPDVVPVLRDMIKSPDKVIRNRALAALVRWQDGESVDWLAKQLDCKELSFRNYVVWALGRIGTPNAIDPVVKAVQAQAKDDEFLWTAIPSLAWLGENALGDKKKKIEDLLVQLGPIAAQVQDPPGWKGTGIRATKGPDPANARSKILGQRLRFALARMGRQSEREATLRMTEAEVLMPNREFWKETLEKIK